MDWIFAASILVGIGVFGAVVWFKRSHDVNKNARKVADAVKDVVRK